MLKKILLLTALAATFAYTQCIVKADEQSSKSFYINSIQKKIERNWVVPNKAEGKSAVVSFTVNPDGTVSDVNVVRSSGNNLFDESAVNAVYKPFPFKYSSDINQPINIEYFFSPLFTTTTIVNKQENSNIVNVANRNAYIDFSDYTTNLQEKINANWKPKSSKILGATAIATIKIDKDGALSDIYLVKTSRNRFFDRSALDAIRKSVPMDAFPAGIKAPSTDVQLVFKYSNIRKEKNPNCKYIQAVTAQVMNVKGYDTYTKQVEKVLDNTLKGKRYFFHKDLIVEIKINKTGKLKYVKVQQPSKDSYFDRKMLETIQQTSFPPVPDTIPLDDVVLNYEIVTQRARTFRAFVFDYLIYNCTTGLKPFSLTEEQ